jgi:hypothetical protein
MGAALSLSIIRLWIAIPIICTIWLTGRGRLLLTDTFDYMSEEEEDINVPYAGLKVARESLELATEFSAFYL